VSEFHIYSTVFFDSIDFTYITIYTYKVILSSLNNLHMNKVTLTKNGDAMRFLTTLFIIASMVMFSSCNKDDSSSSSDQYSNKLTLGTGMNASNFSLIGEGNAFTRVSGTAIIYYRLESATDQGGGGVSIRIEKQSGSSYTIVGTYNYPNLQNYGHITMSSFNVSEAGSYRATGLLTSSSTTVATVAFTVQ
jgi:hypothetical protein